MPLTCKNFVCAAETWPRFWIDDMPDAHDDDIFLLPGLFLTSRFSWQTRLSDTANPLSANDVSQLPVCLGLGETVDFELHLVYWLWFCLTCSSFLHPRFDLFSLHKRMTLKCIPLWPIPANIHSVNIADSLFEWLTFCISCSVDANPDTLTETDCERSDTVGLVVAKHSGWEALYDSSR